MTERWLAWAQRLQAIAQSGLAYCQNPFDRERYHQISAIAAEMLAAGSDMPVEAIQTLFDAQAGYATPKVDVRGVVIRDEKILLVRETLDNGRWTLPGGWADVGETPSEATEREILEEAGYRAKAVKLLALYDRARQGHPPYSFSAWKAFFLCELVDEQQNLAANLETDETGWFSVDNLPELSVARVTERQIRRFFEHHAHPEWPTDFD